ncbi:hypothetical protein V8C86DRAFT_2946168 [Haematococcus lacustris]
MQVRATVYMEGLCVTPLLALPHTMAVRTPGSTPPSTCHTTTAINHPPMTSTGSSHPPHCRPPTTANHRTTHRGNSPLPAPHNPPPPPGVP